MPSACGGLFNQVQMSAIVATGPLAVLGVGVFAL